MSAPPSGWKRASAATEMLAHALRRLWHSPSLLAASAVFLAGVSLVEVNALASLKFHRFDLSRSQLYSLSEPTKRVLAKLQRPVRITVLLPSSDPMLVDVRHLLDAYRSGARELSLRFIDPDRQPAEFLALGNQYQIGAQRTDTGQLRVDAAFILESGERQWFVRPNELVAQGPDGPRPRIEAALTQGLVQLQQGRSRRLCFVGGHGERSIEDVAPSGLSELARRLEAGNIEAVEVPMDAPDAPGLRDCQGIALIGPERPLPNEHSQRIAQAARDGAALLVMLDPVVDAQGHLVSLIGTELEQALGARTRPGFVLEQSPQRRLPEGLGEIFLATPRPHPVTRGLASEEVRSDARVLIVASQPVELIEGTAVLTTSPRGVELRSLESLDDVEGEPETIVVASAHRVAKATRAVLTGSSGLAENSSFRDSARYGNRLFVENAVSWLLESPDLVTVPEGPPLAAGLTLTEESLARVLRYVLLFMPATAAFLGAFVLHRRRRGEQQSRQENGA